MKLYCHGKSICSNRYTRTIKKHSMAPVDWLCTCVRSHQDLISPLTKLSQDADGRGPNGFFSVPLHLGVTERGIYLMLEGSWEAGEKKDNGAEVHASSSQHAASALIFVSPIRERRLGAYLPPPRRTLVACHPPTGPLHAMGNEGEKRVDFDRDAWAS